MPSQITIATDASDSGTYVAVVVGTRTEIGQFFKAACEELSVNDIHTSQITDKNAVLKVLEKASNSILMYCLKTDVQYNITLLTSLLPGRFAKSTKFNQINYCVGEEIRRTAILPALRRLGQSPTNLEAEADQDTERFVKAVGIRPVAPAAAHRVADMVAWFNHKARSPRNVQEFDIAQKINDRLRGRLNL
jgi:hypothetical protein